MVTAITTAAQLGPDPYPWVAAFIRDSIAPDSSNGWNAAVARQSEQGYAARNEHVADAIQSHLRGHVDEIMRGVDCYLSRLQFYPHPGEDSLDSTSHIYIWRECKAHDCLIMTRLKGRYNVSTRPQCEPDDQQLGSLYRYCGPPQKERPVVCMERRGGGCECNRGRRKGSEGCWTRSRLRWALYCTAFFDRTLLRVIYFSFTLIK